MIKDQPQPPGHYERLLGYISRTFQVKREGPPSGKFLLCCARHGVIHHWFEGVEPNPLEMMTMIGKHIDEEYFHKNFIKAST